MSKEFFLVTDPQFVWKIFWDLLEDKKDHPLVKLFDIAHEAQMSALFDVSGIQESVRFRALSRARKLSIALLDEKGEIKKEFLDGLVPLLEKEGQVFYPLGYNDSSIHEYQLHVLRFLKNNINSLKRFQGALCHKWTETLIFDTLGIISTHPPTDLQIKAAVLCACLTPLRQNVGSCFATAPAILIQREQIPIFLDDLYQLLTTGKLKRTFGGVEYALPLSPSTGIGELKKNLHDPRFKFQYSPGLAAALKCAGLAEVPEKIEQKTAEDLIRAVLFKKFGLIEADLERESGLEKMAFHSQSSSQKLHQIAAFKQKEKECRSAFKAVCDNALLRAWEYTLASFSEVKMEFSRWNLYSSLGIHPEETNGIGQVIYQIVDEKISEINKKLEEAQKHYEIAFDQVRTTETLFRNVSSDSDARRLQAEYQSRAYHMRACLELRDKIYEKGSNYSNLYSFLVKQYDQKFPEYFQEIYDAEMQEVQSGVYEDSPAGFRLVYKHGRSDPSLWTLIYNEQQYVNCLVDFFKVTESQIAAECTWEGGSSDILDLTAAIIAHVRTQNFITSALQRTAKIYHGPDKKPWAYTSGGTMTTLLKTYGCREKELTAEEKWVENESELLIFLLDTMKNLPPRITDLFVKNKNKGMLMSSPNHAFILLPGMDRFKQGWQEDIFTYTWVRDEVILPGQKFYADMYLNMSEQLFLLDLFTEQLAPTLSHVVQQNFKPSEEKMSVMQWRDQVEAEKEKVDSFLYQNLPLVPGNQYKETIRKILGPLMNEKAQKVLHRFSEEPASILTARAIKHAAMGCFLLAQNTLFFSFDLYDFISRSCRLEAMAQPTSVLFADSNWPGNYFGFVVNPGTNQLEFWRLDKTLSLGVPMNTWKPFFNGVDKKTWSIFTHPYEYQL